nr:MAG TPA: Putative ATP dependent Clp protease [Caudoviricetes sp.]
MEKISFRITAEKQSANKALIRMTGEIGWDVDAESFRREVDMLVSAGITDAHIYMNGPGGDCFDANEIVNILSRFTGEVTGEGGALVASAYTYIAMHCKSFVMPENGQFMIHKPLGYASGTAAEILAYHKLLSNMEAEYYGKYKARSKDIAELEARWNVGDWWMTAAEAVEAGFVTSVKEPVQIGKAAAMMIAACGYPKDTSLLINTKDKEMDLKTMAVALGLPDNATEEQVRVQIDENKRKAERLESVERENRERAQRELKEKVDAKLDQAIREKRIKADTKEKWTEKLVADFDGVSTMLDSIAPAQSLGSQVRVEMSAGRAVVNGKTFEQLQEEDPEVLAELQEKDPDAFDQLFTDYRKRNKI